MANRGTLYLDISIHPFWHISLLFTTILGHKALICVQRWWYIISHTHPFTLPSLFQKSTHHVSWETQPLPTSKWLSTSFNSNFGYPPVNKHSDGHFPPFVDVFPLGKGGFPWSRTFTGIVGLDQPWWLLIPRGIVVADNSTTYLISEWLIARQIPRNSCHPFLPNFLQQKNSRPLSSCTIFQQLHFPQLCAWKVTSSSPELSCFRKKNLEPPIQLTDLNLARN